MGRRFFEFEPKSPDSSDTDSVESGDGSRISNQSSLSTMRERLRAIRLGRGKVPPPLVSASASGLNERSAVDVGDATKRRPTKPTNRRQTEAAMTKLEEERRELNGDKVNFEEEKEQFEEKKKCEEEKTKLEEEKTKFEEEKIKFKKEKVESNAMKRDLKVEMAKLEKKMDTLEVAKRDLKADMAKFQEEKEGFEGRVKEFKKQEMDVLVRLESEKAALKEAKGQLDKEQVHHRKVMEAFDLEQKEEVKRLRANNVELHEMVRLVSEFRASVAREQQTVDFIQAENTAFKRKKEEAEGRQKKKNALVDEKLKTLGMSLEECRKAFEKLQSSLCSDTVTEHKIRKGIPHHGSQ